MIQHLSPSSIALFNQSEEEFYMRYMTTTRAPRMPQNQVMSIGSSFDAYAKSFLHERLFGKGNDPKFELKALFEAQVEEQNRDWAWEHGKAAFDCYQRSGALADLLLELQQSIGTPRFEFEVKGAINGYREGITKKLKNDVVLLGKPDVFYINKHACRVILDFKVNGWLSKYNISPMPGYVRIRSGSGNHIISGAHKDCMLMPFNGTTINCGTYLENLNEEWATQLAIYGWLVGCDVGSDFIVAIDQLVCKPTGMKYPDVRVAEHRLRIHRDFQWKAFAWAQHIWEVVHSDHFFRSMSKEDSQKKCELMEERAYQLLNPQNEDDNIFNRMTRS